eukprot:TRINITY_DN14718_c0_g1_i5.p1 TRINITY_DN14718_c0_g1~~TRINITY_DN14718_c0_g1_i5.p1  ORF type:complete len:380 (+),score=76.08 TRINITY_DN14718_c0_g1_i5:1283-2422(+)
MMSASAEAVKEAGMGNVFFMSLTGQPIGDSFSPVIQMYPFPTPAFYGGWFPRADLLAVVHSHSDLTPTKLPPEVEAAVGAAGVSSYDLFVCLSDMSEIVAENGEVINLVHHAWAYPGVMPGDKMMGQFLMGAFTFPGGGVGPMASKVDMPINTLSPMRISVHSQKGGMCCSPNNARVALDLSQPVCVCWTVCAEASKRACVSLQLIGTQPLPELQQAIAGCTSLIDVVASVRQCLGEESCASLALDLAMGAYATAETKSMASGLYSQTETEPMPTQRTDCGKGGKGGNKSQQRKKNSKGNGRNSTVVSAAEAEDIPVTEADQLRKRSNAIRKKLNQIAKLQATLDGGGKLQDSQLVKLASKAALEDELDSIEVLRVALR